MFKFSDVYSLLCKNDFDTFKKLARGAIAITNADRSVNTPVLCKTEDVLVNYMNFEVISLRFEKDKYLMTIVREVGGNEQPN